ncbi:MAG: hypothetical protein IJ268_02535 [Proteobacteria bacterium]|nr:hypothetical protein [Pseudomonadota bacterium]
MSIYSKLFGKKKTVDTSSAHQAQQVPVAAGNGPNAQAQMFNDFMVVNEPGDGAAVADVYLNVDTESKSRSHMTTMELFAGNVGHTWLTIKPLNGALPEDLNALVQPQTRSLVEAHGESPVGFWPVDVRERRTEGKKISEEKGEKRAAENARVRAEVAIRNDKGYSQGSGTILKEQAPEYVRHNIMSGRDTAGRVEEPDDAHKPKGRKVYRINRRQFRDMYRYIDAHRTHKYNLFSYNCTTFAAHALQAAGQNVPMEGMTMPTSLYEAMYKEAKQHEKDAQKARRRNRQVGASSVQLLKLAEGEAHRKKGKCKEGEGGKKVRVKGVETFDLPMFTDDAEITLRRVEMSGEVTEDDKNEFAQLLFRDAPKRTLDAVKDYADEAMKLGLMTKGEHDSVIKFYENGFNSLEDPTCITENPGFFQEYMISMYEALPGPATFSVLMDGSSISSKFDYKKLVKQLMWNILNSKHEVGKGFEGFTEPLPIIASIDPVSAVMLDGMAEAIKRYTKYTDKDLYRIQHLISSYFQGVESIQAAAKEYFRTYFNKRIKGHLMNEKMLDDATKFRKETGMENVIPQQWMVLLGQEVEKSRKYNMHSTMFSKSGEAVNTNRAKYVKVKRGKNAPKPDENEIVAEVYLNVDVSPTKVKDGKNVSRSELSTDVGHAWLTLKARPAGGQGQGVLPADIEETMQKTDTGVTSVNIIRAKGETAVGFYPLQNDFINQDRKKYQKRTDENTRNKDANANVFNQALLDIRKNKGFTLGAGSVERDQTQYTGFNPLFKDVTGRVEEPDDQHTPKGRKRYTLTRKQFKQIYAYVEAHRTHAYNLETYNCTTFATHALRAAGHQASGSRMGICYPAKLYRELYDEAKRDARNHNRNSDVQLLKLAANESHGKFTAGKTGNGADVRVKGVEKFDMVEKYVDHSEIILRKIEINPEKTEEYKDEFISSFINFMNTRSFAEGQHLLTEANRMFVLKPKEMQALLYIQEHFSHLKRPLYDYVNMPLSQVGDFMDHISVTVSKEDFEATFSSDYPAIVAKLMRVPFGSADYRKGKDILVTYPKKDLSKHIVETIKNFPASKDLVLSLLDLSSCGVFNDRKNIFNQRLMELNGGSNEQVFQFIVESLRDPRVDDMIRGRLLVLMGNMISKHSDPSQCVEPLTALKAEGHLSDAAYKVLIKEAQKESKKK